MLRPPSPLVAIADADLLGGDPVGPAVRAAAAGVRWVCLRARAASTAERIAWARAIREASPGAFLTVHADPEACRAVGAPGLHLPGRGFDVSRVRRELPGVLLGVSCHDRGELEAARRAGADYVFLSPVFPPASKPGTPLGLERFRELATGAGIPVIGLGGVTPDRVGPVLAAGAAGVAVLGALFLAPDLEARVAEFRDALERAGRPLGRTHG
ncbi:MAG: thiamine phosphate synthase [Candidatus Dadabacteria bacterium]|nr:MAG: thiamine phosphate synthase [Candidatus Dadabacteria bacterium]